MFYIKKEILKNLAKFTEKYLSRGLLFHKFAGFILLEFTSSQQRYSIKKVGSGPCNFTKKDTATQLFSCEFVEIFKTTYFYKTPPVAAIFPLFLCLSSLQSKTKIIFK